MLITQARASLRLPHSGQSKLWSTIGGMMETGDGKCSWPNLKQSDWVQGRKLSWDDYPSECCHLMTKKAWNCSWFHELWFLWKRPPFVWNHWLNSSTLVAPVPKRPLAGENANWLAPGDLLMSWIQKVNVFSLIYTMGLQEFLQLFHGFEKVKFLTSHQCYFWLTG